MPDETKTEKTEVSWSAPEYEHIPKSNEWYWILGILTVALAIAALLLKNILFASFIVLAGFTAALYGTKKPKVVKFVVGARGAQIDDKIYPYENLKSFWIKYDPPQKKELEIISKKLFMPRLILPLEDADPNEVRAILIRALKEEETKDSLSEIIAERLGF